MITLSKYEAIFFFSYNKGYSKEKIARQGKKWHGIREKMARQGKKRHGAEEKEHGGIEKRTMRHKRGTLQKIKINK